MRLHIYFRVVHENPFFKGHTRPKALARPPRHRSLESPNHQISNHLIGVPAIYHLSGCSFLFHRQGQIAVRGRSCVPRVLLSSLVPTADQEPHLPASQPYCGLHQRAACAKDKQHVSRRAAVYGCDFAGSVIWGSHRWFSPRQAFEAPTRLVSLASLGRSETCADYTVLLGVLIPIQEHGPSTKSSLRSLSTGVNATQTIHTQSEADKRESARQRGTRRGYLAPCRIPASASEARSSPILARSRRII
eukprot:scaffold797_cov236-Pinguiococcus_pyrenoidosus.AAC.9